MAKTDPTLPATTKTDYAAVDDMTPAEANNIGTNLEGFEDTGATSGATRIGVESDHWNIDGEQSVEKLLQKLFSRPRPDFTDKTKVSVAATGGAVHESHPSLIELANGNLLCAYVKTSNLYCRISTDDGATWGGEITVYAGGSVDIYPSLIQIANGDVLCLFSTNEDAADYYVKLMVSDDNGATWGSKTTVYNGGDSQGRSSAIQLTDDIIQCFFQTNEDGDLHIKRIESDDDGATWGNQDDVYTAAITTQPDAVLVSDNIWILLFVTAGSVSFIQTINGGTSWSAILGSFTSGFVRPTMVRLRGGILMVAYPSAADTISTRFSGDGGVTWRDAVAVQSGSGSEEPSIIQLSDIGEIIIAFHTTEDGDQDIKIYKNLWVVTAL